MPEVFVSPGVYTREKDFSFYAASAGASSLALIGLTGKGRAMKPILVKNFTDFVEKFGDQDTSYWVPYCAKQYFRYADSAYIVRILGGTGGGYTNFPAYVLSGDNETVFAILRPRARVDDSSLPAITGSVRMASGTTITSPKIIYSSNTATVYTSNTSLIAADSNFITKVFGTSPTDGLHDYLWVEQVFNKTWGGVTISGSTFGYNLPATGITLHNDAWYVNFAGHGYKNARTPLVVSGLYGGSVQNLFQIYALSDGDDSNSMIKIAIEEIDTTNNTFTITVRDYTDTDSKKVVLEQWKKLSLNPTNKRYIAKIIGDTPDTGDYDNISKYIYVVMQSGHPVSTIPAGFAGLPKYNSKIPNMIYKTAMTSTVLVQNQWFGYDFDNYNEPTRLQFIPSASSTDNGFHLDSGAGASYVTVLMSSISHYNTTTGKFLVPMYGGFDGWDIYDSTIDTTASSGDVVDQFKAAIDLLANPEQYDINLLSIPGIYLGGTISEYGRNMVEARADVLYIADLDSDYSTPEEAVAGVSTIDSNYVATYWPYIKIWDSNNEQFVTISPTAAALESVAYTDKNSWPWYAAAGTMRGPVTSAIEADVVLTQTQRDTLYEGKINPIATFAGEGVFIWGNKTLQTADTALNRVNVRRLLLYVRKIISRASLDMVFAQNDSSTWDQFKAKVNPVLDRIKQRHGLQNFQVVMDETTNTPDVIDRETMVGKIYLQPTRSAEMIILDFNILPSGAVFGE